MPQWVSCYQKMSKIFKYESPSKIGWNKKGNICLNCFSKVYTIKNCTSKFSCYKCNKRHNTLLHPEQGSDTPTTSSANTSPHSTSKQNSLQSTSSGSGDIIHTCFSSQSKGVLLSTAIFKICHNGLTYIVRALVDSGSEGTFISERLFHQLKLPYKRSCAQLSGLNNTISATVQKECSFMLGSNIDENFEISTSALVVPHLSGNLP